MRECADEHEIKKPGEIFSRLFVVEAVFSYFKNDFASMLKPSCNTVPLGTWPFGESLSMICGK
jgi:hypothetical protein